MSPIQQRPILHGRDHAEGGADPIPGLTSTVLGGNTALGHRLGTSEDRWYSAGVGTTSAPATNNTVADQLELYPFIPSRDMTLDRIAIQVTSAVAGNARLGFYTDDGNLYPDELLFDTGTFSLGTTGPKVTTISQALTARQVYWAACAVAPASVQLRAWQAEEMMGILGGAPWSGTGSSPTAFGWRMSHASAGALPDPFTGGASPRLAGEVHGNPTAIAVRGT